MDEEIVKLVIKNFGAAGGLAILILAASLWANWKFVQRFIKQHDSIAQIEKDHIKAMAECQTNCEREKTLYRDIVDRRYQEAVAVFFQRDNENRQANATNIDRFENLVGVISDGLARVTEVNGRVAEAINNLRWQVKGKGE